MIHPKTLIRSRIGCTYKRAAILAVVLVFVCACLNADSSRPKQPQPRLWAPEVLVLIWAGHGWTDLVSVCYNSKVPKDVALQDIASFTQQLGWTVNNIDITTKKIPVPNAKPTTSATLETTTQIGSGNPVIVIDPIVLAFRRFNRIKISYLVGKDIVVQAPEGYTDREISITAEHNPGTYQYDIDIKNHDINRLNWPSNAVSSSADVSSKNKQQGFGLIVVFAAACAVGAYFITKKVTDKK